MCCQLLNQEPTRKPGDTITERQLQQLMTEAKALCIQNPACVFAEQLVNLSSSEFVGMWHTMPDLVTCLSTEQFSLVPDSSGSESQATMQSMQESFQRQFDPCTTAVFTQLLIKSCTQPGNPILEEDMPGFDKGTFGNLQFRGSPCNVRRKPCLGPKPWPTGQFGTQRSTRWALKQHVLGLGSGTYTGI
jgi:hypothetical protein